MNADKYNSAVAANVALVELVKLLVASHALDEHKFHQALGAVQRQLNSSDDPALHEAAKAISALYYR